MFKYPWEHFDKLLLLSFGLAKLAQVENAVNAFTQILNIQSRTGNIRQ